MTLALKHSCGADIDVDTNGFGRTVDVCRRCGVLPPEWQDMKPSEPAAATPPAPPTPKPPMAKLTKKCVRSGREFTATGPAAKCCGKCDECLAFAAPTKAKKPKTSDPEKPRKVVRTGYTPEIPSTRSSSAASENVDTAIAALEQELEALLVRRKVVEGLLAGLRSLAA